MRVQTFLIRLIISAMFVLFTAALSMAREQEFYPNGVYNAAIPSPEAFLGYAIGEKVTHHEDVLRYFQTLEELSRNARVFYYGKTHEGRDLFYLVVSSSDQMAYLPRIQEVAAEMSDPRNLDEGEIHRLTREMPSIAWMAYSIHGDELSSTEAAMVLAYQLVAGTDPKTVKLRDRLIVCIDPLQNPDGRERFLSQLESLNGRIPNPDIQSLQHSGFWPRGRGNHYLFDLNRDWFLLVHPESRGKIEAITSWNPQLLVDSHEMGPEDTYLFSPPRAPFNPHMPPSIHKWWAIFASDQARAFDRYGWSYYTREWNEEWYPGYGSSWPIYHSAVGILYEQALTDGKIVKQLDGSILNYRDAIQHQFISSMANLITLAEHKTEMLTDYIKARQIAVEQGKKGKFKAFLVLPEPDPSRSVNMIESLLRQGVEVSIASGDFEAKGTFNYWGEERKGAFPKGTYLIRLDQPLSPLIHAMLDFHVQMGDDFLREEREYLERRKETRLYEVTAWSMPLAYGVETFVCTEIPSVTWNRVTLETPSPQVGRFIHPEAIYGYLIDGKQDQSIDAVATLLSQGFSVRVAEESFKIAGRSFTRGSFLLRRSSQLQGNVARALEAIAKSKRIEVVGVDTALSEEGPDLGGNEFHLLRDPRIAVLSGSPVNSASYGEIWHLLDDEMRIRFSPLGLLDLSSLDLDKYNVLILPEIYGSEKTYQQLLGKTGVEKIKAWIHAGGTFIGIGQGASFAADPENELSLVRHRQEVLKDYPPVNLGVTEEVAAKIAPMQSTGYRADMDPVLSNGNPLGIPGKGSPLIGLGARLFVDESLPNGDTEPDQEKETESESTDEKNAPKAVDTQDIEKLKAFDARLQRFHPRGCFLRVDLDPEHWLTGGLPLKLPVLLYTPEAYIAKDPVQTLARFAGPKDLHVSGLLWPEATGRWAYTAYVTQERAGNGQIILFAGDPIFRGYTHATKRLFKNAIFLGPGLGTAWSAPW